MNITFIYSTAILFVMLLDPFGNLPFVVAELKNTPRERFSKVVLRECFFALAGMVAVLAAGRWFMGIMQVSPGTLRIAGGIILFLIGIKMIFSTFADKADPDAGEPFIVPLAIPLICGPGIIAMLVTILGSRPDATFINCLLALLIAWVVQTLILLNARFVARILGPKALDAFESLMGLLLACIAVGMFLNGLNEIYGIIPKM